MVDPSDRYVWRDFLMDLEKRGCTLGLVALKNGVKIPHVFRDADGIQRRARFTPVNLEGGVHQEIAEDILFKLGFSPSEFFGE